MRKDTFIRMSIIGTVSILILAGLIWIAQSPSELRNIRLRSLLLPGLILLIASYKLYDSYAARKRKR